MFLIKIFAKISALIQNDKTLLWLRTFRSWGGRGVSLLTLKIPIPQA